MDDNKVDQAYLDAHPDSALKIGDVIPQDEQVAVSVEAPAEAAGPDLEKERDERVIPVAQGVLEDLAGQSTAVDVNDRSEFTNVIVKILKRSLAADLNVVTDNSYVWQMVLGAFGSFNSVVMSAKMAEPQTVRYSKIAHEMMELFAGAKVPMGMNVKTEEQVAALQSIKPQLEEIFAREMLTSLEVTYILEGLMNAFKVTEQVFSQNMDNSVRRLEAKLLQIDDMTDLTMSKLDWGLQTTIEDILAADKAKTEERQA